MFGIQNRTQINNTERRDDAFGEETLDCRLKKMVWYFHNP